MAASGSTGSPNFLPYPLDTDPVDVAGDIELLALQTSGRLNVKIDNVTTTLGDTIYTSVNGTPGTIARLAGNTSATRAFLGQTGTGTISAAPSWTLSTGTNNVVLSTSPTITTPVIDTINVSGAAIAATLWNTILTTGSISMGNALTTGSINIANGTVLNGTINIGSGVTTAGTKTINLGATGGAGSTTTIIIGSTTGTSTTTVLGTFKVGVTTLAQGVNGTVTLPATAGTLALNPTTTIGDVIYASATGTPGTLARLAGNTATQPSFLTSTGNGTANTTTSFTSSTGSGNVVLATSSTLTTPIIDTINVSGATVAAALWNTILTTGSISIGGSISGGSINIGNGAVTGNKTIGIGTSATSGTTAITIGSSSGATSTIALNGTVTVGGDMTINGTLTTINSNSLTIDDKNIELGSVTAGTVSTTGTVGSITGTGPWTATITGMTDTADLVPGSALTATNGTGSLGAGGTYIVASIVSNTSVTYTATGGTTPVAGTVTNITTTGATDITANGGGVILKGTTDKTILWDSTNANWTSSEHLNLASNKVFKINNTQVLSSTAVLGLTPTINATGYTLSGGTTAVAVTFAGGAAYTISGTNGQTYTLPSSGGTIALNPTTTIGDIIYASATGTPGTLARLAGNIGTQPAFLTSTGNGSANTTTSFTSSTGSGNVVLATSATITTPTIDTINISAAGTSGVLWNTTITTGSISMGGSLTTGGVNIATGSAFNGTISIATGAGTVNKTINIGTASTSGTTAITIGSSSGATSTTALNGTVTASTAAADTNTTQLATTAFVLGQASAVNPAALGTVAIGTSLRYARADHVHPTTGLALLAGATFTGQIQSTLAGVTTTGGGQLYLNGTTSNRIDYNTNGVAAPAFTTRSAGTKIVYFPAVDATNVDYAVGIENSNLWYSIPQATVSFGFKWYGGQTNIATLSGTGAFTAGSFTPTSSTAPTNGMYLSAANTLSFSTNSVGKFFIDTNGASSFAHTADRAIAFTRAGTNTFTFEHDSNRLYIYNQTTTTNAFTILNDSKIGINNSSPSSRLHVNTGAIGELGVIIQGFSGQTADLVQWQNSTPSVVGGVTAGGSLYVALSTPIANTALSVSTGASGNAGIVVRGVSSQAGNLQSWQNSTPTTITSIDSTGTIRQTSATYGYHYNDGSSQVGRLVVYSDTTTSVLAILRGIAGQTGNLQEWQTSTPTTPTWVDQNAVLNTSNTPTSNNQVANKLYVDNAIAASVTTTEEIIPLDDISNEFNNINTRFVPRYQGTQVSILNPLRLLLTINGIIQYVNNPEYVWMSGLPQRGFFVDSDGQLQFSEAVPAGSEFDARIMSGNATTTRTRVYPFKPLDILLGG